MCPYLQSVKTPVNINTTPLSVLYELQMHWAGGALCPIIEVINEVVKKHWSLYQPVGHTTSNMPPAELCVSDYNSLSQ